MPTPKVSAEEKLQTQLLEALCRALDGTPHRLQGSGKTPGLFPGGQAGAILIHRGRTEGFLQDVPSPEPPPAKKTKAKPPVFVVITDRGRQFVLQQQSPTKVLAGLREGLESQGVALTVGIKEIQEQLANYRKSVDLFEKSLAAKFTNYQQTAQAFREVMDRLVHQPTPVAVPVVPRIPGSTARWIEEVVPFVAEQKRLNSFDRPNLKRVYEHLRQMHPTLTLGEFHDGLRGLHRERRIRLDPYTQALATLQDTLHALYLDREVKYYVDLP